MLKGVFFCFGLLIGFKVMANPNPDSVNVFLLHKTAVTSVDVEPSVWNINDSLFNIPAFDLYCSFDQKKIWGLKVDQTKKQDTTLIQVAHDSCDFGSPWVGRLTSDYGWRGSRPHYGVDIKLQTGDSVRNAFDGMVRIARYSSTYGNVIVIRHENGLETLYAHLSKRIVSEGDKLAAGETLGLGGNTGRSSGSHLHFETRYLGEPLNPHDVFEINDSTFKIKNQSLALDAENFIFLKEVRKIKYHRVRSGDSLWRISKRYGVSISRICRLNSTNKKDTLRIGQKIRYN